MTPREVFPKIAKNVAGRYRGFTEADDVEQELWVWWITHDEPELLDMDWALTRTLYTVAERYCKREKAARVGPDEGRYTANEVMAIVEFIVNPPSTTDYELIGVQVSEVMGALAGLDDELRLALLAHASGESFREIATRTGLSWLSHHTHSSCSMSSASAMPR